MSALPPAGHWLTTSDAATFAGVSAATIRQWRHRGYLAAQGLDERGRPLHTREAVRAAERLVTQHGLDATAGKVNPRRLRGLPAAPCQDGLMVTRKLCGIVRGNGKDCDRPVPEDAPAAICLDHMKQAYLYVRDKIAEWEPGTIAYDPIAHPEPSAVYYAAFGNRIKIGTSADPWNRMAGVPHDQLIAVEPGDRTTEGERHRQFGAFLASGREWFRDCPEIRAHASALREQYGDPESDRDRCVTTMTAWWRSRRGTRAA